MPREAEPYIGPRPFEQTAADRLRFFGRDREGKDLVCLLTAHPAVLLYAQSGAGKTSLLNAQVVPQLKEQSFDVLPVARARAATSQQLQGDINNVFTFNTLLSWSGDAVESDRLARMRIPEFLEQRERASAGDGLLVPRIAIFEQFEEFFTAYPERRQDLKAFFSQIRDAPGRHARHGRATPIDAPGGSGRRPARGWYTLGAVSAHATVVRNGCAFAR